MQIGFDLRKATDAINNGPALDTMIVEIGKHKFKLEKVATIWHRNAKWSHQDDYVFRISMDGQPMYDFAGSRAFIHPNVGVHREILGTKVFGYPRPKWMPKDIHMHTANAKLHRAMTDMLGLPA